MRPPPPSPHHSPSPPRLRHLLRLGVLALALAITSRTARAWAGEQPPGVPTPTPWVTQKVAGWTVQVRRELLESENALTAHALELLKAQLDTILRDLPSKAAIELQKVPLFFSPEYKDVRPTAEFHPDAGWLRAHDRDPAMAKGVEFTNLRIFDKEQVRMPNFVLHELAHAYHDRVLPGGFGNRRIRAAFDKARASGTYDRVERWNGQGRPNTFERAYAMTNPMEYFAETTEAFFGRNDFFPFTRQELERHDPEMFALLRELWHVPAPPARITPAPAQEHGRRGSGWGSRACLAIRRESERSSPALRAPSPPDGGEGWGENSPKVVSRVEPPNQVNNPSLREAGGGCPKGGRGARKTRFGGRRVEPFDRLWVRTVRHVRSPAPPVHDRA